MLSVELPAKKIHRIICKRVFHQRISFIFFALQIKKIGQVNLKNVPDIARIKIIHHNFAEIFPLLFPIASGPEESRHQIIKPTADFHRFPIIPDARI